jgi:uncharacterized protein YndB with AHSA1/START domain
MDLFSIGCVLVIVIAVFLLAVVSKPDKFRYERSARIKAPPEKVYALIQDFHQWNQWSPWEGIDPDLKRTFSGAEKGKGAVYEWQGNKTGQGRMEIVDAPAPSKVTIKLDFLKPFEAHNTAEFTLVPEGDSTTVTWAMFGPNLFMGKLMSVFINMDKMLGKDFEKGLSSMKAIAEK